MPNPKPATESAETMSYIGRKQCGCIFYAAVDVPELSDEIAKAIAKIVRAGGTIERVTSQYVRDNMRRCPHER